MTHTYAVTPEHPQGRPGCTTLWCQRCGAKLHMLMPISVTEFCAAADAFAVRHARCGIVDDQQEKP